MPNPAFDFDSTIDRRNTGSVKWDMVNWCPDRDDVLPMWVADMDFRSSPQIIQALNRAVDHGVFGYTLLPEAAVQAVADWVSRRYNWTVETDQISFSPGVVTALNIAIQAFTDPGDGVIIQSPVYPPFFSAVNENDRRLLVNQLSTDANGAYIMDFDDLREKIDERTRMVVLCSPHNPVGRVWNRNELEELGRIATDQDLLIFSDDIHADLVFTPNRHIPIAGVSREISERTVTAIAPSKTFNIPGLQASMVITTNQRLKRTFDKAQERVFGHVVPNSLAAAAVGAAYGESEPWLDAAIVYLRSNRDEALRFIRDRLPGVIVPEPEATYLLWLDFSAYAAEKGLTNDDLRKLLYCGAGVAMNDGRAFGPGGDMHFRLNFGCPRSLLRKGLDRIADAL